MLLKYWIDNYSIEQKKGEYGIIVISSATDPYLKIEKEYQLTRQALELIYKYKFPVHIITKSDLIERDYDILKKIETTAILPIDLQGKLPGGVIISFSFSTVDDAIAKIFEPGATKPSIRIQTVKNTLSHGFFTGISMMPLLPFITDTTAHLKRLFTTFKACEVDYILPATLTLFGTGKSSSKSLVFKAIQKHYPELLERYQGYFQNGSQMPKFYQTAFDKKMKELSLSYDLSNSILSAAANKHIGH